MQIDLDLPLSQHPDENATIVEGPLELVQIAAFFVLRYGQLESLDEDLFLLEKKSEGLLGFKLEEAVAVSHVSRNGDLLDSRRELGEEPD